jgi:hypothetical protein
LSFTFGILQVVHSGISASIFADGNLASSFEEFGKDHKCNKYCEFYDLPQDFPDSRVPTLFGASFERMIEEDEEAEDSVQADSFWHHENKPSVSV